MNYEDVSIERRVANHAGGIDFSLINVMALIFVIALIVTCIGYMFHG